MKEVTVDTNETQNPAQAFFAYKDAGEKSDKALDEHPDFFTPEHIARAEAAKIFADRFFRIKKGVYLNHRGGGKGRAPTTAIKINGPTWTADMQSRKQAELLDPLADFGVTEIKNTPKGIVFIITK